MSNRIPDDAQGELQGVLASSQAVTTVISPIMMTQIFGAFTAADAAIYLPGAPFLAAAALMVLAVIPFAIGLSRGGADRAVNSG
jgi:DHA1 family tetracycline resistance protein-like MFS transporter